MEITFFIKLFLKIIGIYKILPTFAVLKTLLRRFTDFKKNDFNNENKKIKEFITII